MHVTKRGNPFNVPNKDDVLTKELDKMLGTRHYNPGHRDLVRMKMQQKRLQLQQSAPGASTACEADVTASTTCEVETSFARTRKLVTPVSTTTTTTNMHADEEFNVNESLEDMLDKIPEEVMQQLSPLQ